MALAKKDQPCIYKSKSPHSAFPVKYGWLVGLWCFNTTFNNISVISWLSVLLVEKTEIPSEKNPTDKLTHINEKANDETTCNTILNLSTVIYAHQFTWPGKLKMYKFCKLFSILLLMKILFPYKL